MLQSAETLRGYHIRATDDAIGTVETFLFDDQQWVIRYLVVDTGGWLSGRQVLVSPMAIRAVDRDARSVAVELTRAQVENSPDIVTDQPVSRQKEEEYLRYYGYPRWWGGPGLWGAGMYPMHTPYLGALPLPPFDEPLVPADEPAPAGDPHLRSAREVVGYHIRASDGEIGHVDDFIVEERSWAIRYLVVDTRNWLPGRKVLVAPRWVGAIDWASGLVDVRLTRTAIENGPAYDPDQLDRDYERRLHGHYLEPVYWEDPAEAER